MSLIIIFIFLGLKNYFNLYKKKYPQVENEFLINESIRTLNECFDLENKNKRSIKGSMVLIEYCLKEYGYKKHKKNN